MEPKQVECSVVPYCPLVWTIVGNVMRVFASLGVAVLAAAAMALGFWLSGFDFTERGGTAVACYIASLVSGAYGFGSTMMATSKA